MSAATEEFQDRIWQYYAAHGRHDLPWRELGRDGTLDPYAVLVSELMLQQTQVPRVVPKFNAFMAAFPTVADLAGADLADVLRAWSGLGYNRRAKFLWQAAGVITARHGSRVPHTAADLVALPGIGPNTAGAVLAYAYNQPVVFIETNIRSVFIHHFFPSQQQVDDAELRPLIAATLPADQARDWYWALMDYGTHLKQTVGNTARLSRSYSRQSAFQGSRRKIRGQVLKHLALKTASHEDLAQLVQDDRLDGVLADLGREGLVRRDGSVYHLGA